MPTQDTTSGDEAQIRKLIEQWAAALRAKDLEGVLATFGARREDLRLGTAAAARSGRPASGPCSVVPRLQFNRVPDR